MGLGSGGLWDWILVLFFTIPSTPCLSVPKCGKAEAKKLAALCGCLHRGNESCKGWDQPSCFPKRHQPHPDVAISNPEIKTTLPAHLDREGEQGWGCTRRIGLDSLINSGAIGLPKPRVGVRSQGPGGTSQSWTSRASSENPQTWQVLPSASDRTMCHSGWLLGTIYHTGF